MFFYLFSTFMPITTNVDPRFTPIPTINVEMGQSYDEMGTGMQYLNPNLMNQVKDIEGQLNWDYNPTNMDFNTSFFNFNHPNMGSNTSFFNSNPTNLDSNSSFFNSNPPNMDYGSSFINENPSNEENVQLGGEGEPLTDAYVVPPPEEGHDANVFPKDHVNEDNVAAGPSTIQKAGLWESDTFILDENFNFIPE
ncbi:hypothetical protein ACS0TY_031469 [Phlomoides rotata]